MSDKPAKKFRLGFITATIWANESPNGDRTWYSVEIARTYKDGDDLKTTNAFNAADLLNVAKLAERSEHWIAQQ